MKTDLEAVAWDRYQALRLLEQTTPALNHNSHHLASVAIELARFKLQSALERPNAR